jgi:hypothetical protein
MIDSRLEGPSNRNGLCCFHLSSRSILNDVRRSAIFRCVLLGALLLLLGLGIGARRAEAGCHVADPPRILGTLLDQIEGVAVPDQVVAVRPGNVRVESQPCRGEIPVSSTESVSIPAMYAVIAFQNTPIHTGGRFLRSSRVDVSSLDRDYRLDRPPRGVERA